MTDNAFDSDAFDSDAFSSGDDCGSDGFESGNFVADTLDSDALAVLGFEREMSGAGGRTCFFTRWNSLR